MYEELVKDLRCCSKYVCHGCPESVCSGNLMSQAADAIEELSAFRAQITDGNFYCMRDGVLYERKVEPPIGKAIVLPPIKFAEPPKEES